MTTDLFIAWSVESLRKGGLPPIVLFIFHVIASRGFEAYERFPPLDIPMHFLGGVAIAYFFHRASVAASNHGVFGPFHQITHIVLVIALTGTTTLFWEFAEFIADRCFGTHAQLGLADTLGDMLLGLCGGAALLVAVVWRGAAPRFGS